MLRKKLDNKEHPKNLSKCIQASPSRFDMYSTIQYFLTKENVVYIMPNHQPIDHNLITAKNYTLQILRKY
jgi:hypothetical protein